MRYSEIASDVNSEIVEIEQIEHMSEISNEEDNNENSDVNEVKLLDKVITTEVLPQYSGKLRKRKWKKMSTILNHNQSTEYFELASYEKSEIEKDEADGSQSNQVNISVVNSAENTPTEESCEQVEQIPENSNENTINDMLLLVPAIKIEDIPKSSGELRKKRKLKKIKKIQTKLRDQQKKTSEKTCPHCDFKSNSPFVASLVEHIMSKHEGVRW